MLLITMTVACIFPTRRDIASLDSQSMLGMLNRDDVWFVHRLLRRAATYVFAVNTWG